MSNEHRMGNQPPLNVPVEVLAGDVARLQSANIRLHHEKDELRAEVERLNRESVEREAHHGERMHEFRSEVDIKYAQIEQLRAKLKWFEAREPFIREGLKADACGADWDAIEHWEAAHPKPHDPDELDKHLEENGR